MISCSVNSMDYGPFGFIEEYNPLFAKWTGSGQHFAFMNQPQAGFVNYNTLVMSVVPVIAAQRQQDPEEVAKPFLERATEIFEGKVDEMFRTKLGFESDQDVGDEVWSVLEPLLRKSRVDWTLFFRQLTYASRELTKSDVTAEHLLSLVEGNENERNGSSPFYEPLSTDFRTEWIQWIKQWQDAMISSGAAESAFERMAVTNPKYVLREWMMVDAYTNSNKDMDAELYNLYSLIQRPYEEGSAKEVEKYYRRAPDELLTKGGVGFMSCSS